MTALSGGRAAMGPHIWGRSALLVFFRGGSETHRGLYMRSQCQRSPGSFSDFKLGSKTDQVAIACVCSRNQVSLIRNDL